MADDITDSNEESKASEILNSSNPFGIDSSSLDDELLSRPDPAAYIRGDFSSSPSGLNPLDYLPGRNDVNTESLKPELATQEQIQNLLYNSGFQAVEEAYDQNFMGKNHLFGSGIEHHQFDRYHAHWDYDKLGFSPFRDNEALYNENTNWGKEVLRAAPQFAKLARLGFADALTFGDATDTKTAAEFEKAMAIGQSNTGGVGAFTSNLFLNAGYTVGIISELAAEEAVMAVGGFFTGGSTWGIGAMRAGRAAQKIYKGAKLSGKLLKNLDRLRDGSKARSFWKGVKSMGSGVGGFINPLDDTVHFINNYNKLGNLGKMAKTAKGFGSFYRDVRNIRLAFGESSLEGGMVQNEVSKTLYDEFKEKHGRAPNTEEAIEIGKIAKEAGQSTTMQNFPAIFYSNKIVFDNMFKGFSPLRALTRDPIKMGGQKIIQTAAKESPFELAQKGLKGFWKSAKTPSSYAKFGLNYFKANVAEGLQETTQEIIGGWTSDYYKDLYRGDATRGAYYSYISDNIQKQFSPEGGEIFLSGFLMGGLVQGPQKLATNYYTKAKEYITHGKEGFAKLKAERLANAEKVKNTLNDMYDDVNKYLAPDLQNLVAQKKYNEGIEKANKEGDAKAYHDLKHAAETDHVLTALQMGRLDTFIEQLESQKNLTEEEIQADARYKGMTKADFDAGIDMSIERAKQVEERYDLIEKKYPNPFMPDTLKGELKKIAQMDHAAWESAKKQAVFMQSTFDNTLRRMDSMYNDAKADTKLKNTPTNDFNILFKRASYESEIQLLKAETQALEDSMAPESKKEYETKKKKLELLENYAAALQDYTATEITEELELAVEGAGPREKAEKGYDEFYEQPTAGAEPVLSTEEEAVQKLYDAYEAYLKEVAKTNDDYVFDENIQKAFQKILDFNQLSNEAKIAADAVNDLINPAGHQQAWQRERSIIEALMANKKAEIAASYDEYQKMMDTNEMLSGLHDLGMFFDPEQVYDLLDKGEMPSNFYYAESLQEVVPLNEDGTENADYTKAINFVESWVGEVMNMPIPQRKGSSFNTKARNKINNDKRTYADLANQFGFDPNAPSSKVELVKVLDAIINSPYSTKREKALALRLKDIASDGETVTFVNNSDSPGSYSETTQTVIDARYSSHNYRGGNTPIEHVILHEEIHRLTVKELAKDGDFKKDISNLLTKAREHALLEDTIKRWGGKPLYGLKNEAEFVAEAMSNDQFQRFLAEISSDVATKSGWSEFVGSVLKMLKKVFGGNVDNTVLNGALGVITNKIDKLYGELVAEEVTGIEAEANPGDYARVAALAKKLAKGGEAEATTDQELADEKNYPNLLDEYIKIEEDRRAALLRAANPLSPVVTEAEKNAFKEKVKADIDARFAKIKEIKVNVSLSESNTVKAILKEIAEIVNSVYEYEQDPLSIEDALAEEKGIAENEITKLEERGYEFSTPGELGTTLTPDIDVTVTKVNNPFVLSDQADQKKIISRIVAVGISLEGSVMQEPQVEVTVEIKSAEELKEALSDLKAEKEALENIDQPTWQEDNDIEVLEKALEEAPTETEVAAEPTVDTEAINKEFDKKIAAVKPQPVEKKIIKEGRKGLKIKADIPITTLINEHPTLARDLLQAYKNEESKRGAEGQPQNLNESWAEMSEDQLFNSAPFRTWFKNFSKAKKILKKYNEDTGRSIEPVKKKKKTTTPKSTAGGVKIITTRMKNSLIELGYTNEEVRDMTVEEAQSLIDEDLSKGDREAMDLAAAQTKQIELEEQKQRVRADMEDLINSANNIEELNNAEVELHTMFMNPDLRSVGEITSEYIQELIASKKERMAFDFKFEDFIEGEVVVLNDNYGTKAVIDRIDGNNLYGYKKNDPTRRYRISKATVKNRIKYKFSPLLAEVGVNEEEPTAEEQELSNEAKEEILNTPENTKEYVDAARDDEDSGWLDDNNINEC